MSSQVIIALDFSSQEETTAFLEKVDPKLCAVKIGSQLFTLCGPLFVKSLVRAGYQVFLDLKFHDIPNTVAKACLAAVELGIWMLNVHASGGLAMMKAAREAIDSSKTRPRPLLIAVTVLTSMNANDMHAIGVAAPLEDQVGRLAVLAKEAGCDGVVCGAPEVPLIKKLCGSSFLTVTPGIRFENTETHDQARILSPEEARQLGSDFLVVGRSVTQLSDPRQVIEAMTLSPSQQ